MNDRYQKICSNDIPITGHLFGDNCLSKLKEMGDISKYPIAKFPKRGRFYGHRFGGRGFGRLNVGGHVPQRGGQGFRGRVLQGRRPWMPRYPSAGRSRPVGPVPTFTRPQGQGRG